MKARAAVGWQSAIDEDSAAIAGSDMDVVDAAEQPTDSGSAAAAAARPRRSDREKK